VWATRNRVRPSKIFITEWAKGEKRIAKLTRDEMLDADTTMIHPKEDRLVSYVRARNLQDDEGSDKAEINR